MDKKSNPGEQAGVLNKNKAKQINSATDYISSGKTRADQEVRLWG